MKSRTLPATAMIPLTPLVVLAFQARTDQVRNRELKSRSFTAGALKITLTRFYAGGIDPKGYCDGETENFQTANQDKTSTQ